MSGSHFLWIFKTGCYVWGQLEEAARSFPHKTFPTRPFGGQEWFYFTCREWIYEILLQFYANILFYFTAKLDLVVWQGQSKTMLLLLPRLQRPRYLLYRPYDLSHKWLRGQPGDEEGASSLPPPSIPLSLQDPDKIPLLTHINQLHCLIWFWLLLTPIHVKPCLLDTGLWNENHVFKKFLFVIFKTRQLCIDYVFVVLF